MEKYLDRIEHFLSTQTIWIFGAAILQVSILMTMQYEQTWAVYLNFIGKVSLVFVPVLLYSIFRNALLNYLPQWAIWSIRALIFLLYPFILTQLNSAEWYANKHDFGIASIIINMSAFFFVVIEGLLVVNEYWRSNSKISQWLKQLHLEKGIFIFMAIFSIVYAVLGKFIADDIYFQSADLVKMIGYTIQIFLIVLFYYIFYWINHYLLITRLLKQKGVIYYVFGFAAVLLFLYPIIGQIIKWLPLVTLTDIHPVHHGQIFEDVNWMIPFVGMLASIPFILAVRWLKQSNEISALAKEKSEAELSLLKQQINPHFFFNTLNNLYALSITKDKQTPEVILQLSELMRYVIYRGKEVEVQLKEEVKYIEDYIQLQQIRIHKELDFRFSKLVEDDSISIPPLLFITFVENAFKHGIEPAEGACFLDLYLKNEGNTIIFTCENSVEIESEKEAGIGLQNLKRRLELLFPNQHELNIEKRANSFFAQLEIQL